MYKYFFKFDERHQRFASAISIPYWIWISQKKETRDASIDTRNDKPYSLSSMVRVSWHSYLHPLKDKQILGAYTHTAIPLTRFYQDAAKE